MKENKASVVELKDELTKMKASRNESAFSVSRQKNWIRETPCLVKNDQGLHRKAIVEHTVLVQGAHQKQKPTGSKP